VILIRNQVFLIVSFLCIGLIVFTGCTGILKNNPPSFANITRPEITPLTTFHPSGSPVFSNGSEVTGGFWVSIDPVEDHTLGENFTVPGKTNLPENTMLSVVVHRPWSGYNDRVHWADWCLMHENQSPDQNECGAAVGEIKVIKGESGVNLWKFDIYGKFMSPITYLAEVNGANVSANTTFKMTNTQQ
jgi:hypothetical protein